MAGPVGHSSFRRGWVGLLGLVLTLLLAAPSLAIGISSATPAGATALVAELPPSDEYWPACDEVRTQYCVNEFTIDGVDMLHSTEWRMGVTSLFWDPPDEGPMSFNWYLQAWDTDGGVWYTPPNGWRGYVTVGINSGAIVPRWTQGYGDDFSLVPGGNDASGYTIRAEGYPIDLHRLFSDDGACSAGLGCGDEMTRADTWVTAFGGNTQDMFGWDRTFADPAGQWIVTDAQYFANPFLETWPEPHWVIQLSNVHLKADGTPVEGIFTAYMPPKTITDNHLTVDEALALGIRVTRTDGSEVTVLGGSVERFGDGVLLRLPLDYSSPTLRIYPRAGIKLAMPPSAPRSVAGMPVNAGAVIRFEAPSSTGGSPIASYTVSCEYAGGADVERTVHAASPVAIQVTVPIGVEASCRVRATNAAGKVGSWSYPVSVTPTAATVIKPGAPAGLGGTALQNGNLVLSWDPPASKGGAASILDYSVKVCPANRNCVVRATATTRAVTLPAAQLPTGWYTIRVQARNVAGIGDGAVLLGPASVVTAPALSTSLSATRSFRLTWALPAGGKYPSGTTYDVWMARNGASTWTPLVTGLRSKFVDVPLASGTTYRFKVQAVTGSGITSANRSAVTTIVPFDDKATGMSWTANWTRFSSTNRFAGGAHRTAIAGASVTFTSTGTRIYLVGDRGPDNGRFRVRVDGGAWSAWISSYASSAKVRQVLWTSPTLSDGPHTVKIAVEGTTGHPKVVVDGIAFRR